MRYCGARDCWWFQRLFDASPDSDIPKHVPFTLVINTRIRVLERDSGCVCVVSVWCAQTCVCVVSVWRASVHATTERQR